MSFTMTAHAPRVEIIYQIYYQRFRYGTENRQPRKHREGCFMKVKLSNIPPKSTMKIFCVKSGESRLLPHPNTLDGPDCQDGVYFPNPFPTFVNQEISVPWLQINRAKKDNMDPMLQKRSELLPQEFSGGCHVVREHLQKGKKINSNQVCLCVHVSGTLSNGEQYQVQALSKEIKNEEKGTKLKIDELCLCSASVHGGVINHIFTCEDSPNIEPDMIEVHMEETDQTGNVTWTSEPFIARKEDIRYKHVIDYPVPQYHNQNITECVTVMLVMRCVKTQEEDRCEFMYQPLPDVVSGDRKRKVNLKEKYAHLDFPPNKILKTAPAGAEVMQNLRQTLNIRSNTNPGVATSVPVSHLRTPPQVYGGSIGKKIPTEWEQDVQTSQPGPGTVSGDAQMVLDDQGMIQGLDPVPSTGDLTAHSDLLAAVVRDSGVMETDVCCDTTVDDGVNVPSTKPAPSFVHISLKRDTNHANSPWCLAYMQDPAENKGGSDQSAPSADNSDIENMLPQTVLETHFEFEDTSSDSLGFSTFPVPVSGKVADKLAKMISHPDVYPNTCGETDIASDIDLCSAFSHVSHSDNQDQAAQPPVVTEQPSSSALPPLMGCGSQSASAMTSQGSSVDPPSSLPVLQNGLGHHSSSSGGLQDAAQYQNGSVGRVSLHMPSPNTVTSPEGTPSPAVSLTSATYEMFNLDSEALESLITPELLQDLPPYMDANK